MGLRRDTDTARVLCGVRRSCLCLSAKHCTSTASSSRLYQRKFTTAFRKLSRCKQVPSLSSTTKVPSCCLLPSWHAAVQFQNHQGKRRFSSSVQGQTGVTCMLSACASGIDECSNLPVLDTIVQQQRQGSSVHRSLTIVTSGVLIWLTVLCSGAVVDCCHACMHSKAMKKHWGISHCFAVNSTYLLSGACAQEH